MFKNYKEEKRLASLSATPTSTPSTSMGPDELRRTLGSRLSQAPKDVMISYSHADKEQMLKLRDNLEKNGVTVWVDVTGLKAGVDFLSKIGQAIIDAQCFISLLSESSVASKYCQDELALAYVSSKPIFPVGLKKSDELFPKMDTGMKLQLARFNWNLFTNPDTYDQDLEALVSKLKTTIEKNKQEEEEAAAMTDEEKKKPSLKKRHSQRKMFNKQSNLKSQFLERLQSIDDSLSDEKLSKFWITSFGDKEKVTWTEFSKTFQQIYDKALKMSYGGKDQEWLMGVLYRELMVEESEEYVTRENYDDFCTVEGETLPFWVRVQDQAVESYTMKEVFDMESSVRVEAIENLGKFNSSGVIAALWDLLKDRDNNVRAVAAISLARTGDNSEQTIRHLMKTLSDKDRLVRESGCLALGHLKVQEAVPKIVHLWRNDFISHVREAAQVALEQIGGEEAGKAMHMTKVLSEEIRYLTHE